MISIYENLVQKKATLAVIGLGYVGLPIALEFAKKIKVIAFDINPDRVDMMKNNIDPSNELEAADFKGSDISFTANIDDLKLANFYIVAVPTPVDSHKVPDLKPVLSASKTVGQVLSKGDYVVYESTVYPGCTEEDCLPVLEVESGLTLGQDFKIGYSPERINPGDKENTLASIVKVASGSDEDAAENIVKTYELVIDAGVHKASSIKVAEAAKIIENTQRDVNIALMNELSIIFDKMGINTFEVLEAAGTKWNFLKFFPGLVGGHCIGVDPYYLTYKANELGYNSQIILSGRKINDSMAALVAKKVVQMIIHEGKSTMSSRVLVMGATFKEDVSDIRNSKVAELVAELQDFSINVDVVDPHANADEVKEEYGFELKADTEGKYDAIIVAVNHREYAKMSEDQFQAIAAENAIFVDLKGVFRGKINKFKYWSL
jgi:UDP-N-acetyl-D-galactosamine dehydrogenase